MNKYYIYDRLLENGYIEINVKNDITKENWRLHYDSLLNLIRDYIETNYLKVPCISVEFEDGRKITLGVVDYWYNIIAWYLIIIPDNENFGRVPKPNDLYFPLKGGGLTTSYTKNYLDNKFVIPYRTLMDNEEISEMLNEFEKCFLCIDEFSLFLMNTINFEDTLLKYLDDPETRQYIDVDLSNISLEDSKKVAMKATDKYIAMAKKDKSNPLSDYFISDEGIKRNQFSEAFICIAQKPDGEGSIYPIKLDCSFCTTKGQLDQWYIESSTGRLAQIILNINVGTSGDQARKLGLGSMDTSLHPDPHYDCNTRNLIPLVIRDENELKRYVDRYYRFELDGREYKITKDSHELVGKRILLRSPITCASKDMGGVCYKCYGDLAYTNACINIGKYAVECLTAILTQRMLSVKHLLAADIIPYNWNSNFDNVFEVDSNEISVKLSDTTGYYIELDTSEFIESDESDDTDVVGVTSFNIVNPDGEKCAIESENGALMRLTPDFLYVISQIQKKKNNYCDDDEKLLIPLGAITDIVPFTVDIINNELSNVLNKFTMTINKNDVTSKFSLEGILAEFNKILGDMGANVSSVHAEIIIANQVRSVDDVLENPDWENINEPYQILAANSSMFKNKSIIKTLSFQDLNGNLVNPLSYRKTGTSSMDLAFMEKPQEFFDDDLVYRD